MTRTAISPRFAISTLENIVGCQVGATSAPSERNVAVLLRRIFVALAPQALQRIDQGGTRVAGIDDVVEIAVSRRDVGVREFFAILLDLRLRRGSRIVAVRDLLSKQDLDRPFRAHHRDLGSWPGDVEVAADVLRAHHVVRSAVSLPRDDGQLRYRCLAVRIEQLRPVLDDSAMLLADSGKKAGDILE